MGQNEFLQSQLLYLQTNDRTIYNGSLLAGSACMNCRLMLISYIAATYACRLGVNSGLRSGLRPSRKKGRLLDALSGQGIWYRWRRQQVGSNKIHPAQFHGSQLVRHVYMFDFLAWPARRPFVSCSSRELRSSILHPAWPTPKIGGVMFISDPSSSIPGHRETGHIFYS